MQNNKQQIDKAVAAIEHVRSRLGMYIYPIDPHNVQIFLTGLQLGMSICGIRSHNEIRSKIRESRELKKGPEHPIAQMKAKGMNEQQVIDELLDMEIEVLRQSRLLE